MGYYLHDEPQRVAEDPALRFTLVGHPDRRELDDLEAAWRTAESTRRGRPLVIDVRRLGERAEHTRNLLDLLRHAGAEILEERETRRGVLKAAVCLALAASGRAYALRGSEFWDKKDPAEWTSEEVQRLTTKSPWARQVTAERAAAQRTARPPRIGMGRRPRLGGGPRPAAGGRTFKAVVRWESARPVLLALRKTLPEAFLNHYVISVSGVPLGGGGGRSEDVLDHLKAFSELEVKGRAPVQPGIVQRERGTRALLFGFSRDLLPLGAGDKEVTFATHLGQVAVKAKFNPKDMRYRGELAL